jgi:hypothetical protein
LAAIVASIAHAEVQIERTYLPHDATPSSFAIGLPGGVSFCFDPVRAAVSYAWTGGFVDMTTARPGPGKFIATAKPLGPVVYRETGPAPLRRGDPARTPVVEFAGYTLRDDAVEFRYTIDGVPVTEHISAKPDGSGLVRRFNVRGATDAKWWYVTEGKPPVELAPAGASELKLEISFGKATPP